MIVKLSVNIPVQVFCTVSLFLPALIEASENNAKATRKGMGKATMHYIDTTSGSMGFRLTDADSYVFQLPLVESASSRGDMLLKIINYWQGVMQDDSQRGMHEEARRELYWAKFCYNVTGYERILADCTKSEGEQEVAVECLFSVLDIHQYIRQEVLKTMLQDESKRETALAVVRRGVIGELSKRASR